MGTLWVPLNARATPKLGPFPFFYWYKFIWVLISSALCWIGYLILKGRPAAERDEGAADEPAERGHLNDRHRRISARHPDWLRLGQMAAGQGPRAPLIPIRPDCARPP
jgi:hypothetical protein